jgi:hypothetical protein
MKVIVDIEHKLSEDSKNQMMQSLSSEEQKILQKIEQG